LGDGCLDEEMKSIGDYIEKEERRKEGQP